MEELEKIKVLIVDDHQVVLQGYVHSLSCMKISM
jgi:hypothetical protein